MASRLDGTRRGSCRPCVRCGRTAPTPKARYCTQACRQSAYRDRLVAGVQSPPTDLLDVLFMLDAGESLVITAARMGTTAESVARSTTRRVAREQSLGCLTPDTFRLSRLVAREMSRLALVVAA